MYKKTDEEKLAEEVVDSMSTGDLIQWVFEDLCSLYEKDTTIFFEAWKQYFDGRHPDEAQNETTTDSG